MTVEVHDKEAGYMLEEHLPLSQSLIWKIQRNFYEGKGLAAWGEGFVPFHPSTNPFMANVYAQIVLAFIRDWSGAGSKCASNGCAVDWNEPIYIVELGSGPGRLGFYFLRQFTDSLSRSPLKDTRFKYILTDLAEKNLEFWLHHAALKPFVEAGVLDFALFDAENPAPLSLHNSGMTLSAETVANPLVLIANYFFDSIPHDCFYIEGRRLLESRLSVFSSQPEADRHDPKILERLSFNYSRRATTFDYYEDAEFNRILEGYRQQLNRTAINFPIAALECLRFFRKIAHDRLMLLTSDIGYRRTEDLAGRREPRFLIDGCFWTGVNYNAIGRYFLDAGGQVLTTTYRCSDIDTLTMLLGEPNNCYTETQYAFHEYVEKAGPGDYSSVRRNIPPDPAVLELNEIVAYLRFNRWDSKLFSNCIVPLLDKVASAGDIQKKELLSAIHNIRKNYFYMGEEPDVIFMLGRLLFELGAYTEAIEYFNESSSLFGGASACSEWISGLLRSFGTFRRAGSYFAS